MKNKLLVMMGALGMMASGSSALAQDTTPPAVDLQTPAVGATVTSRKVTISGEATDEIGVVEVRYRIERSRRWRKAVLTEAGGTSTTFVFNARLPKRGHARVYVRAIDAAGNESDTTGRKYIINKNGAPAPPVDNGGGDGGGGNGDGGGNAGGGIPGVVAG